MKKKTIGFILATIMTATLFISCTPKTIDSDVSAQQSSSADMSSVDLRESSEATASFPDSFMLTGANRFDYQAGFECSAFSSAYVLRHYGEEADGMQLFENFPGKLYNDGVSPYGIVDFFTEKGYKAEFKTDGTIDELKAEISKGVPVIAFIHVEEPYESSHNTHYIPLVGYDKEHLYFSESLDEYANCKDEKDVAYNRKTDIEKFKRLWADIDSYWERPYFVIAKN